MSEPKAPKFNPANTEHWCDASDLIRRLHANCSWADVATTLCFALILANNNAKPPQSKADIEDFIRRVEKTLRVGLSEAVQLDESALQ